MSPIADCNPRAAARPTPAPHASTPRTSAPPACAPPAERLAEQLASILPDAVVVQVRLMGPRTLWPHLRLTAVNERGHVLRIPRAKALTIARWIIRSFPHAGWAADGHAFDLRTAKLHGLEAR